MSKLREKTTFHVGSFKVSQSLRLWIGISLLGVPSAVSGQPGNLRPSSLSQASVGAPEYGLQSDEEWGPYRSESDSRKPDNPDLELIREWLNKRKPLPSSELKTITIGNPLEMASPSLQRLFPSWRFYKSSWYEEYTKKGRKYLKKKGIVDSPFYLGITFSVNRQTRHLIPFYDSGNCESFGELLAHSQIAITSLDQAEAVWNAFCEIHDKQWRSHAHVKSGPTQWRLAVSCIGDTRYYYEVNLDEAGVVIHGTLKAEKIPDAKSPPPLP